MRPRALGRATRVAAYVATDISAGVAAAGAVVGDGDARADADEWREWQEWKEWQEWQEWSHAPLACDMEEL
ncbi:hypothetical protein [Streptomyces lydicus]|uniref:hypothetical protein n=1 Tax=Streptomyces lydicus TaxID=47763 RepID=UPI0010124E90|nr:hypothetical protein [Streptomyces lydicus]MCZ1008162.1 hypothetical protein [Streptomyces lydicus]